MTILYRVHHGLYASLTNRCSCACTFCVRGLSDSVGEAESLWLSREPTYEEVIAAFGGFDMGQFNEVVSAVSVSQPRRGIHSRASHVT